jgi:hypothetical protein
MKKALLKWSIILLVVAGVVIYAISHFKYSEGTRTGYLSKFSKKGFVFNTYEAELFVGGATADNNTLVNNIWAFSVRDTENGITDSLQKYEGNVVKVYYYEVLRSMPWQGDTRYFVYKVDYIREK